MSRMKREAVDGDADLAHRQRDPGEDVGDRVRQGAVYPRHTRDRVELERLAHDHGADVEGPGDGGDDRDDTERRRAQRAGQVEAAGRPLEDAKSPSRIIPKERGALGRSMSE
jgi:hypothetical protein